eukprot:TRINITY_DN56462_c0_g1_i1.p1 TRINITY_DN56462_c0_g1~~TRINITY_DN56462_c0_g1_i1.p1  ORF type:complete len:132 (-),score=3.19 TRINITY_DN56462_c0_g1_i1:140-535(-)
MLELGPFQCCITFQERAELVLALRTWPHDLIASIGHNLVPKDNPAKSEEKPECCRASCSGSCMSKHTHLPHPLLPPSNKTKKGNTSADESRRIMPKVAQGKTDNACTTLQENLLASILHILRAMSASKNIT